MPEHETWGDLPAHEIVARIMAQERSMLYEPSRLLPPSTAPSPIRPIRPIRPISPIPITPPNPIRPITPISPIPIPPTTMSTEIPNRIRNQISKFNSAAFTTNAIAENLPDIPVKRIRDLLSGLVRKGWLAREPGHRPAHYKQVRPFSEPPISPAPQKKQAPPGTSISRRGTSPAPAKPAVPASREFIPPIFPPGDPSAAADESLLALLTAALRRAEDRARKLQVAIQALS